MVPDCCNELPVCIGSYCCGFHSKIEHVKAILKQYSLEAIMGRYSNSKQSHRHACIHKLLQYTITLWNRKWYNFRSLQPCKWILFETASLFTSLILLFRLYKMITNTLVFSCTTAISLTLTTIIHQWNRINCSTLHSLKYKQSTVWNREFSEALSADDGFH